MNTKTRIAVIGLGYWGPNLVRNFNEIEHTELVAIVDRDTDQLEQYKEMYPHAEVYESHKALFDLNLDGVVIATPPHTHYFLAKEFLNAGLNVLVEKPLALNADDCEDLIRIADANKRVLMVGHILEYHFAILHIKAIIDSGELGKINYINAERAGLGRYHHDHNVMWDLAPHDLSVILRLLGEAPIRVSATGASYTLQHRGIEDLVNMHLVFPNNTVANIRLSWLDPEKARGMTIVGTKKMLVFDDIATEKIKIYDTGADLIDNPEKPGGFEIKYRQLDVRIPELTWTEPLRSECEHFANCIQDDANPVSDGLSGLTVVQIMEAADESLAYGGAPVDIVPTELQAVMVEKKRKSL